jgi:hypothetical protein
MQLMLEQDWQRLINTFLLDDGGKSRQVCWKSGVARNGSCFANGQAMLDGGDLKPTN